MTFSNILIAAGFIGFGALMIAPLLGLIAIGFGILFIITTL